MRILRATILALALSGAAVAAAPPPPPAPSAQDVVWLSARLSGGWVPTGGDSDGDGHAVFAIEREQRRVCYTMSVRRIGLPRWARLHMVGVPKADPVIASLDVTGPGNTTCAYLDADMIDEMAVHPQRFYVRVHNRQFADGALQGELRKR